LLPYQMAGSDEGTILDMVIEPSPPYSSLVGANNYAKVTTYG